MPADHHIHRVPQHLDHVDLAATVSLINDGTVFDHSNLEHSLRLTVDPQHPANIAIDVDLDLGIAGQTIAIAVDRKQFADAVRAVSPQSQFIVGEVLVDPAAGERVVVREDAGHGTLLVATLASGGQYRVRASTLHRPRTMIGGA